MKIGIGNDHHGVHLKQVISTYLEQQGYEVINFGTDTTENVDYTTYAFQVGEAVRDQKIDYGVLICGSGIGMSIALNKMKGIYCAKVSNLSEAMLSKAHNNANVMAISSDLEDNAMDIVIKFIETPFSNIDRYIKRNNKIKDIENV